MYYLNLYIIKKLGFTFFISLITIKFIMSSGVLFKLFNKRTNLYNIGEILLLMSPEILSLAIPLSLLIATMLTYNRLNNDGELTAMRSGAISMWQIISPPLFLSIFCTAICLVLQFQINPKAKYQLRSKLKSIALEKPALFIKPQENTELFPKQFIYIDSKKGEKLKGIFIKIFDDKQRITQAISAESGSIFYNKKKHQINIPLNKVTILSYKYNNDALTPSITRLNAQKWTFSHQIFNSNTNLIKRDKHLTLKELLVTYQLLKDDDITKKNKLTFQIHKKIALALSPLALVMLSLAVGLKRGRRENKSDNITNRPFSTHLLFHRCFI